MILYTSARRRVNSLTLKISNAWECVHPSRSIPFTDSISYPENDNKNSTSKTFKLHPISVKPKPKQITHFYFL